MSTQQLLSEGLVPTPGKTVRRPGLHALTGIRFFAAAWVMTYHFGAAFTARAGMPRFVTTFLERGNLGVALFFMLSGFILFYTYQSNLRTPRDLYKFFVARFARLYPVYLLALVISSLLNLRLPHGKALLIFPMLQAWTPPASDLGYTWVIQAWTLSVEAFFYICFPVLLLFFRRKWPPAVLWSLAAAVFVLSVALRSPLFHPGERPPTWLSTHILLPVLCLPEFLLGMVLGSLFLRKHTLTPGFVFNDWITFAGLLPCCALIAAGPGSLLISLAAVTGFGWAIYRLAAGQGWLTAMLSSKLMMLLGGASFAIYLLQGLMREFMKRLLAHIHPGLDAAVAPVVLIALCCLIFLYYEEPLRDVLRNLLIRKDPRRV